MYKKWILKSRSFSKWWFIWFRISQFCQDFRIAPCETLALNCSNQPVRLLAAVVALYPQSDCLMLLRRTLRAVLLCCCCVQMEPLLTESEHARPTRVTRRWSWRKNSTSTATWRADAASRWPTSCTWRSDRSRSGSRTDAWSGRKITGWRTRQLNTNKPRPPPCYPRSTANRC